MYSIGRNSIFLLYLRCELSYSVERRPSRLVATPSENRLKARSNAHVVRGSQRVAERFMSTRPRLAAMKPTTRRGNPATVARGLPSTGSIGGQMNEGERGLRRYMLPPHDGWAPVSPIAVEGQCVPLRPSEFAKFFI